MITHAEPTLHGQACNYPALLGNHLEVMFALSALLAQPQQDKVRKSW
jgi:hypothetical protein